MTNETDRKIDLPATNHRSGENIHRYNEKSAGLKTKRAGHIHISDIHADIVDDFDRLFAESGCPTKGSFLFTLMVCWGEHARPQRLADMAVDEFLSQMTERDDDEHSVTMAEITTIYRAWCRTEDRRNFHTELVETAVRDALADAGIKAETGGSNGAIFHGLKLKIAKAA